MSLLIETVNGILPVFLIIFLGIFLNRLHFFSETTKDELVKLVFYVGTPALIFHNVATTNLYQSFQPKLIGFLIVLILLYVLLLIICCKKIGDPAKKAAIIQIGFRSNFAIVGMPLALNLMSKEGVAKTAVTLAFVVITYNVLAVGLLSYYGAKEKNMRSILLGILKNPLIIGTVAGLLSAVWRIRVPILITKTLSSAGDIASSVGLLVLGATISVKGFKNNQGYIALTLFFRNLLAPLLFLTSAVFFGFRGDELLIVAILSATPAAVNCFVMAKKMGADPDISAFGVSLSSIVSIFSVFFSVYFIKLLELI